MVGFLGSVGNDAFGDRYISLLVSENITPIFEAHNDQITGLCLVICNNNERTHYTDLGVSTTITPKFVNRFWDKIKDSQLIFTELFIIKHQYEILKKLAALGSENDKIFGFNLPSFWFLETFINKITFLYSNADIVFCNLAEARYFGNLMGFIDENSQDLAVYLAGLPKKNQDKKRVVVITCGSNPAIVCEFDFQTDSVSYLNEIPIRPVDASQIVDTNGAGDSFAGGFLSQYMQGKSLEDCMICGHWAASLIIQSRGCQIPYGLTYDPEKARRDVYGEKLII